MNRSLPLHVQKAVWGRVLVYQALDRHRVRLEAAGYGLLWTAIRDRLLTSTAMQVEFDPAGSITSYLKQLGAELRTGLLFPDDDAERACISLLDDIDRALAEASHAQEDLLLGAFGDAVRAAAELYGAHGLTVPPGMTERVSATFEHQLAPIISELPIQLTAVTELRDQSEGPSAHVRVLLSPNSLGEETVFALPYVLLHECVCHVLQGPWQPGRVEVDASSRFAEGWMDVVAYTTHRQTVNNRGHADAGPRLLAASRPAAQLEAAETVHRARYRKSPSDRAWAQRAMGVEAAQGLTELLARLPQTPSSTPDEVFTRLSLRLNTSAFSNRQRDMFVGRVHKAIAQGNVGALVPGLREYLATDELDNLVKSILQLFT